MTFLPAALRGDVTVPPSKSELIRALILAAFANAPTFVACTEACRDVKECASALSSLGVSVEPSDGGFFVRPAVKMVEAATLCVPNSAAVARFLAPVLSALHISANSLYGKRLSARLDGEEEVAFSEQMTVDASRSSQTVSGLLLGAAVSGRGITLRVQNAVSAPYVALTVRVLARFGVTCTKDGDVYTVPAGQKVVSCGRYVPEGDWSAGAVWLCAGALSGRVRVHGLCASSCQADRAVVDVLRRFGATINEQDGVFEATSSPLTGCEVDLTDCPDLCGVVAALGAVAKGETRLYPLHRLRKKECDRAAALGEMLSAVGAFVRVENDALVVRGTSLHGGCVSVRKDHRMLMAASLLGLCTSGALTATDTDGGKKSYPSFLEDYTSLGGRFEPSSTFGSALRVTLFGVSHGPCVGVTVEGFEDGFAVDEKELAAFLARRAPSSALGSTTRREPDEPIFTEGLQNGKTHGVITALLRNADVQDGAYDALKNTPRPGHADLTQRLRYGENVDLRGGGHLSGRLTAPLCVAGGLCLQWLKAHGIFVSARIVSVHGSEDFEAEMVKASRLGDSVGGVVECVIAGLPGGVGNPHFDGLENVLSQAVFAVPAVKGVAFGDGFALADRYGSEVNDAYAWRDGKAVPVTNHAGGILGGISTGADVVFRVAVKPTPSVSVPQKTVNLATGEETELRLSGRYDVCIVPRAVPCVEAAAAVALVNLLTEEKDDE